MRVTDSSSREARGIGAVIMESVGDRWSDHHVGGIELLLWLGMNTSVHHQGRYIGGVCSQKEDA